jgi:hypothetical protein
MVDILASPLIMSLTQLASIRVKWYALCMTMDSMTPSAGVAIIGSVLLNGWVENPYNHASPASKGAEVMNYAETTQ